MRAGCSNADGHSDEEQGTGSGNLRLRIQEPFAGGPPASGLTEDTVTVLEDSGVTLSRAELNADGTTDINDAFTILGNLFPGDKKAPHQRAGEAKDDDVLNISHALHVLILFLGGRAIDPPAGTARPDPTSHASSFQPFLSHIMRRQICPKSLDSSALPY